MANFSITARQSDIAKWYKDRAAQQANYNTWNDLVKAYTQQATTAFEESTQAAQQSAAYDISQAYANYKQQQIAASLNQNISAGAKDVIGSQLASAYDVSAAQSQYNLASNLKSIYDSYYKTVSTADETLAEQFGISNQAKTAAKGLQYLNKYISESNEYQQLWENVRNLYDSDEAADEALDAALFQTTGEGADMTTGLSDLGKEVLGSLLHRGASFGEDDKRKSYKDIYDYLYATNQDAYNLFADQPGVLDEYLGLDTANSIQRAFTEDTAQEIATASWFNANARRYGIKQIRKADESEYGEPSKDNLGSALYQDVPVDTSFIGDIDPTQIENLMNLTGYQRYDSKTDSYTFTYRAGGKNIDISEITKLFNAKQIKVTSGGSGKAVHTISIPASEFTQRALYKDSSGNIHIYPKSEQPKESSKQGTLYRDSSGKLYRK